jgi:hypothetical protein
MWHENAATIATTPESQQKTGNDGFFFAAPTGMAAVNSMMNG